MVSGGDQDFGLSERIESMILCVSSMCSCSENWEAWIELLVIFESDEMLELKRSIQEQIL